MHQTTLTVMTATISSRGSMAVWLGLRRGTLVPGGRQHSMIPYGRWHPIAVKWSSN